MDLSKKNEFSGVEIQNASNFLSSFLEKNLIKNELKNIKNAKLKYSVINNTVYISIEFNIDKEEVFLPISMYNPNNLYA